MAIVKTPDVLGGEPRLEGHRISVLHVADPVLDGQDPAYVADQLGLSLEQVHEALAYYYGHPDEMDAVRREHAAAADELRNRSRAPTSPAA